MGATRRTLQGIVGAAAGAAVTYIALAGWVFGAWTRDNTPVCPGSFPSDSGMWSPSEMAAVMGWKCEWPNGEESLFLYVMVLLGVGVVALFAMVAASWDGHPSDWAVSASAFGFGSLATAAVWALLPAFDSWAQNLVDSGGFNVVSVVAVYGGFALIIFGGAAFGVRVGRASHSMLGSAEGLSGGAVVTAGATVGLGAAVLAGIAVLVVIVVALAFYAAVVAAGYMLLTLLVIGVSSR